MKKVTAVCNSGPLMALAKLGILSKVFSAYPALTISETVYHKVVISGLAIGAKEAAEIDNFCQSKKIVVFPSNEIKEVSLDMYSELHQYELEMIKIALQHSADCVFIDDLDARHAAEENLQKISSDTTIKGTPGILVELYQKNLISRSQLKEYHEEINHQDKKDFHGSINLID